MKTYGPSVCWQADKETGREEQEEEKGRQRGACKERNEVMKKKIETGRREGKRGKGERVKEEGKQTNLVKKTTIDG